MDMIRHRLNIDLFCIRFQSLLFIADITIFLRTINERDCTSKTYIQRYDCIMSTNFLKNEPRKILRRVRHLLWLLEIRIAHSLQKQLSRRNLNLSFQVSRYRPRTTLSSSNSLSLPRVGIVVQGPLLVRGDLTLKICESLASNYPSVPIILSTWPIADKSYFERFRDLGIKVQICTPPTYPGLGNINLQITTTKEGIEIAQKLGCEFVLKMRTDTWFSESDFLDYLCEEFLLESSRYECEPIIVTSFNTSKVREFSINDQIQFGRISNLMLFWNPPLDMRSEEDLPFPLNSEEPTKHSQNRLAEVWLVTHYLESQRINYEFTQQSYLEVIAKYFVVIDESILGMVWHKAVLRDMRTLRYQRKLSGNPNLLRSDWMKARRILLKGEK